MANNRSYGLRNNADAFRKSDRERAEFLEKYDKAVSKAFKKRQAEEIKAYDKHKGFVIRWP
jgi:hypothetical protein